MDRRQGIISAYIDTRGFGFLVSGEGPTLEKLYFHISGFVDKSITPRVGDSVLFGLSPIRAGKCATAIDLEVVSGGSDATA